MGHPPVSPARALATTILLLGAVSCAPSIPPPTLLDAARAAETWPEATLADLEEGHSLFVRRCAGCHNLPDPRSRGRSEWMKIAPKMARDARFNPQQAELVTRYLICMSERPTTPESVGSAMTP